MSEVKRISVFIHGPNKKVDMVEAAHLDAAQSELAALREELSTSKNAYKDELRGVSYKRGQLRLERDELKHSLTAAERRNASLLESARGLTIQLHATIGNTELHEDCIRDLEALDAKD